MGGEAGEDVVGELPNRFGHDEGGVGVDVFEDLHAVLLAFDEAVSFVGDGVGALDGEAFGCDGGGELGFHVMLDGPAGEVSDEAEVSAGDELDGSGVVHFF